MRSFVSPFVMLGPACLVMTFYLRFNFCSVPSVIWKIVELIGLNLLCFDQAIRPSVLDSSVKSISSAGVFTGRQISMSLSEETPNSKIPVRGCNSVGISSRGSTSKAEEFICFDECQNHKVRYYSCKQDADLLCLASQTTSLVKQVLSPLLWEHASQGYIYNCKQITFVNMRSVYKQM